jgi:uncharacterized lipoprotein YmbA
MYQEQRESHKQEEIEGIQEMARARHQGLRRWSCKLAESLRNMGSEHLDFVKTVQEVTG